MTTIKNGCPVCGSDVSGDKEHKYLCKNCKMLFDEKDLEFNKIEDDVAEKEKEMLESYPVIQPELEVIIPKAKPSKIKKK